MKRGWNEHVEPGIKKAHAVACPSTSDRRAGRRCRCPYKIKVPGRQPGSVTDRTVHGSITVARNERRIALAEGRPAPETTDSPTLLDWSTRYFKSHAHKWEPATVTLRSRSFRLHIEPVLGHHLLTDLDLSVVQQWIDGFGGRSRHMEIARDTLRAMLNTAVREGLLPTNPVLLAELPEGRRYIPDERFALTPDQLGALIDKCENLRDETLIRVASEAGLRRGELAGLRWSDVDLDARRINVNVAIWQDKKVGKIAKAPKSGAARRVAISPETAERLRHYRREQSASIGAIPSGPVWPGRGSRTKGQSWDQSQPMSPSSISHIICRLMKRAELVDTDGNALLGTQGLRRTAGSIPLMANKPLIAVSRQLGHSRVTTTANHYARAIQEEQLDDVASVFERTTSTDRAADRAATPDEREKSGP